MVKHIVLFKLKDDASADAKLAAMHAFKDAIEALPAKIPFIRKIEVGLNINPAETWSIALYSEFDTLDDVRQYAVHPDHVAAGKLLAEVKESRACVDTVFIDCLFPGFRRVCPNTGTGEVQDRVEECICHRGGNCVHRFHRTRMACLFY